MPDVVAPELDAYTEAHTTPPPPYLSAVAERTRETLPAPGMMVGTVEGRLLEMLVFATGAKRVLEIGTFSGFSALAMAAALPDDGRIVTCELDPVHAEAARANVAQCPHVGRIEVIEGPALETIRRLEGPLDLVFIDADKANYLAYYEAALDKLADRGLIVADNTLWSGRVVDPSDVSEDTEGLRVFNDAVVADRRVVCVQLPVRDGVTLVRLAPTGSAGTR